MRSAELGMRNEVSGYDPGASGMMVEVGRCVTRGAGERKLDCEYYSDCLGAVARARWPDFHCGNCGEISQPLAEASRQSAVGSRQEEIGQEAKNDINQTDPASPKGSAGERKEEIMEQGTKEYTEEQKQCGRCYHMKTLDKFKPIQSKRNPDGLSNLCLKCLDNGKNERAAKKQKTKIPGKASQQAPKMAAIDIKGLPPYYRLVNEMTGIYEKKNKDYGAGHPAGNFLESSRLGIEPWKGALLRMTDKYARAMTLASGREAYVNDENLKDTLLDLANYALLTLVLLESN